MAWRWMTVLVVGGLLGIGGCGDVPDTPQTAETQSLKSAAEPLTDAEMQQFLRLIARLPDGRVPEFTPFEQPQLDTLLPAKMLVTELRARYRELSDPERQGLVWEANLDLAKPAMQEGWTSAQLASFIRCLSCAVVKQRLAIKHDLKQIEKSCRQAISQVVATLDRDDQRPRSQMTEEFMLQREQQVQRLARMVAMLEFMLQLKSVPESNLELVKKYDSQIRPLLPEASTQDPFIEPFADVPVDRQGVVPVGYQAN